jgi:NADPH-dependent glutamate synthase beta subunit-like oxidoreductase
MEDEMTEKKSFPENNRQLAPCTLGCPAGIDVPRYIGYVALGKHAEATAVVRERIPFPAVCSYICYRPCEPVCRRALWEAPVAINAIKKAAAVHDTGLWRKKWDETIAPPTGKRVAVVGSGPAGLTAAYYLGKRCGHEVTIFESQGYPGGQLRLGVPPNRLPRRLIDEEIAVICENRVEIQCNHQIGELDELFKQGYQAVFLAVGTCVPRDLGIPGENLPGVWKGVHFLQEANLGVEHNHPPAIGRRVAIIGAGNVAVDCARTALRLGAKEVRILYRRTRKEMPSYDFEMRAAETEKAKVEFLVAPTRIEKEDGALKLFLTRQELGEPDASGRATPRPISGSDYVITVDAVMAAIGQVPGVSESWRLARNPDGTINVEEGTLKTSRRGVFAGGDVVLGPMNIIGR